MFSPIILSRAHFCPLCRTKPVDLQDKVEWELDAAVAVSHAVMMFSQYTHCSLLECCCVHV